MNIKDIWRRRRDWEAAVQPSGFGSFHLPPVLWRPSSTRKWFATNWNLHTNTRYIFPSRDRYSSADCLFKIVKFSSLDRRWLGRISSGIKITLHRARRWAYWLAAAIREVVGSSTASKRWPGPSSSLRTYSAKPCNVASKPPSSTPPRRANQKSEHLILCFEDFGKRAEKKPEMIMSFL